MISTCFGNFTKPGKVAEEQHRRSIGVVKIHICAIKQTLPAYYILSVCVVFVAVVLMLQKRQVATSKTLHCGKSQTLIKASNEQTGNITYYNRWQRRPTSLTSEVYVLADDMTGNISWLIKIRP